MILRARRARMPGITLLATKKRAIEVGAAAGAIRSVETIQCRAAD